MVEGSDEAVNAWAADECNGVLGQELSSEEELSCPDLVHEGKMRELEAWTKFKVFNWLPILLCILPLVDILLFTIMSIMKYINIFVVLVQNQILVYCNNHLMRNLQDRGSHQGLGTRNWERISLLLLI